MIIKIIFISNANNLFFHTEAAGKNGERIQESKGGKGGEVASRKGFESESVYKFNHLIDLSERNLRAKRAWDESEKVF